MSQTVNVDSKHFISASAAGKLVGYTSDYIGKLAREGKIEATRVGRNWYVSRDSVVAFKLKVEEEKKIRSASIREERLQEQVTHKQTHIEVSTPRSVPVPKVPDKKFVALTQTLVILVIGLVVGVSGYGITTPSTATVVETELNVFERFALSFYELIAPRREEQYVILPVPHSEQRSTTTYTSFIVAPNEVFTEMHATTLRESFSDEVDISVDPQNPDTGIIIPRFRERDGEEYRFLMVPVREPQQGG